MLRGRGFTARESSAGHIGAGPEREPFQEGGRLSAQKRAHPDRGQDRGAVEIGRLNMAAVDDRDMGQGGRGEPVEKTQHLRIRSAVQADFRSRAQGHVGESPRVFMPEGVEERVGICVSGLGMRLSVGHPDVTSQDRIKPEIGGARVSLFRYLQHRFSFSVRITDLVVERLTGFEPAQTDFRDRCSTIRAPAPTSVKVSETFANINSHFAIFRLPPS